MNKGYNRSNFGAYFPVPKLSPYTKINKQRLKNPKFIFKHSLQIIKKWKKEGKVVSWRDVGCANGEFIYYLCQKIPDCKFYGVDITKEFINTATTILKNFKNVKLSHDDILNPNANYKQTEVVSCTNTIQIFPKPDNFLNKLIDLVKPGGILVVEAAGCFNPFDISMSVKYLDESNVETKNLWRCDFNLFSEKMIKRIISKRKDIKSLKFEYPIMDQSIPKVKGAPDINMWTEPKEQGGYNIVNGMNRKFNPGFLIIEKI